MTAMTSIADAAAAVAAWRRASDADRDRHARRRQIGDGFGRSS